MLNTKLMLYTDLKKITGNRGKEQRLKQKR